MPNREPDTGDDAGPSDAARVDGAMVDELAQRLAQVRARIDSAATAAGRRRDEVRLLPVSKTVGADRLRAAITAGCRELGENKVQEALGKHELLADTGVRWSIIGHLQTNKIRHVVSFADEFQALDSLKVAEGLERRLQQAGRQLDVFVQVNTSGEDSKFGLPPSATNEFVRSLAPFETLRLRGLMTLAIFSPDTERVRECFRSLRSLRDELRDEGLAGDGELSMGMSGDFELAIEEGATCVRVGQALFGARPTPDSEYWPGFAR